MQELRFSRSGRTSEKTASGLEMEGTQKDAFEGFDLDALKSLAETLYETKINAGLSPEQARNEIKNIEPFNNFEELIDSL